jgi:hypothetical protein
LRAVPAVVESVFPGSYESNSNLESAEEDGDASVSHSALERALDVCAADLLPGYFRLALMSAIGPAQHQLALLCSLARILGAPTRQNFA